MCRKAVLGRSATEAHSERQYGNENVVNMFCYILEGRKRWASSNLPTWNH